MKIKWDNVIGLVARLFVAIFCFIIGLVSLKSGFVPEVPFIEMLRIYETDITKLAIIKIFEIGFITLIGFMVFAVIVTIGFGVYWFINHIIDFKGEKE